jgi:hypothetical protein
MYKVLVIDESDIVKELHVAVEEHDFDIKEEAEVVFESFCSYHDWVELRDTSRKDDDLLLVGGRDFC